MPPIKPIKVFRKPPGRPKPGADPLAVQLNLGPKSAAWLRAAGITSPEQIGRLGVIETCRQVRAAGFPVSVLLAYALEGALAGCHWINLPAETKQWLRVEFTKMKRGEAAPPPVSRRKRPASRQQRGPAVLNCSE